MAEGDRTGIILGAAFGGALLMFASSFFWTRQEPPQQPPVRPPQAPADARVPLAAKGGLAGLPGLPAKGVDSVFLLAAEGAKPGSDGRPVPRLEFSCSATGPSICLETAVATERNEWDAEHGVPLQILLASDERPYVTYPQQEPGGRRFRFRSPLFFAALLLREETVVLN